MYSLSIKKKIRTDTLWQLSKIYFHFKGFFSDYGLAFDSIIISITGLQLTLEEHWKMHPHVIKYAYSWSKVASILGLEREKTSWAVFVTNNCLKCSQHGDKKHSFYSKHFLYFLKKDSSFCHILIPVRSMILGFLPLIMWIRTSCLLVSLFHH